MKRFQLFSFAFLLCMLISGCAVVDISDKGSHAMVSVHNTVWEIFSVFPVASGNHLRPNKFSCRWFQDTVTLENNIQMLENAAKALDATHYKNVSSSITDETVFFILVNRRVYHTSAELVFGGNIPDAGTNDVVQIGK